MRQLCLECRKVYDNFDDVEITSHEKPGMKTLGVKTMTCECGAVNRFRPEDHWNDADKLEVKRGKKRERARARRKLRNENKVVKPKTVKPKSVKTKLVTTKIPDDDKCSVNRCRDMPKITYLGNRLCDKHWDELCKKELLTEMNKISKEITNGKDNL